MKVFHIIIIILCLFLLFIIIESIREIRQLKITEYNISHYKLPKEFNGYKIILLADLHNCFHNTGQIIEVIKKETPNGVIIAGDLLVYGDNQKESNYRSFDLIKEISNYSDVYYAPGNHEMGYMIKKNSEWLNYEKYLLDNNIDNIYFLDNKFIELSRGDSSIKIYGLHLTDGYYKRFIKKPLHKEDIDKLLGVANGNDYNIMIAHNPDYFIDYCTWGADVILSGHNHGGLLKLPGIGGVISPRLRLFPKFDYGLFYEKNSILVLTGGLGAHSLKIRVNNKPELVVINFIKE